MTAKLGVLRDPVDRSQQLFDLHLVCSQHLRIVNGFILSMGGQLPKPHQYTAHFIQRTFSRLHQRNGLGRIIVGLLNAYDSAP